MVELQKDFDPSRYQGLWYDVARFPKFFDKHTPWMTAEYTLKGKHLKVHNIGYNEDGSVRSEIRGRAIVVDPRQPAALYVSFPNIFSEIFGNPEIPNYLIHATDYETYSVVGSYDKKSLYILARERPISQFLFGKLLEYVSDLGYDISRLQQDYLSVSSENEE